MNNTIVVLVGPTAVGKTYVAVELAKKLKTEIISADSMQIYKEMNIGTAKVTDDERCGVVHHMIDIIYPSDEYSVSQFKKDAELIIDGMLIDGKTPIITGGSGLYVNALIYDLDFGQARSDEGIRHKYMDYYALNGENGLYSLLVERDPQAALKIHKNNIKRVIRALEVYDITGVKFSEMSEDIRKPSHKYNCILLGLCMERHLLYEKIDKRVDKMIEGGLIGEVRNLIDKGYDRNLVSMKGIGYKEIVNYLCGEVNYDETIRVLKRNTRHFAKRQFTWFMRDPNVKWFNISDNESIDLTVNSMYNYIIENKEETN